MLSGIEESAVPVVNSLGIELSSSLYFDISDGNQSTPAIPLGGLSSVVAVLLGSSIIPSLTN